MLDYGWFYLKWDIGNNCFSYSHDKEHQLRIPYLKETLFEEAKNNCISLWEKSVFAEVDEDGKLQINIDNDYNLETEYLTECINATNWTYYEAECE
jgi:hypothetical protein